MKKNLLIALFATASMAGAVVVPDTSDGNWSIMMELDAGAIHNIIQKADANLDADEHVGINLVSWSGSAHYREDGAYKETSSRNASYWMGWGNNYFSFPPVEASTGLKAGLQMGFFEGTHSDKKWSAKAGDKADLNSYYAALTYTNNGYYRAHTKVDSNGDGKISSDEDLGQTLDAVTKESGFPTDTGRGDLTQFSSIDNATLAIVHSTTSEDLTGSITLQYLTVTGTFNGEEGVTIRYIAQVDDSSTVENDFLKYLYPGSGRYDVDVLTGVEFADGYVNEDHSYVLGEALTSDEVLNFDYTTGTVKPTTPDTPGGDTPAAAVPEPTTATLSLLALAGLCARRRRR